MTNKATQEFLDSTEITGALSPAEAAALMALAMGDTVAKTTDDGALPGSTTKTEDDEGGKSEGDKGDGKKPGADATTEGEKPHVLMAKDGVHTIDYQKLVDAREGERAAKERADTAEQELATLRAEAQARADSGKAATQQDNLVAAVDAAKKEGVDISIFGDMSEEAMAKGIKQLVDQQVAAQVAEAVKPFKEQHAKTVKSQEDQAADDHKNAVLTAHPDAVSIWQSTELQKWIGDKPGYEQAAIRGVLEGGETADLIAVFTRYKTEAGIKPAAEAPAATDPKDAAKAAIAAAAPVIPASLSSIPGARSGATGVHDTLAAMDAPSLSQAMRGMSPSQIEAYLNRQM